MTGPPASPAVELPSRPSLSAAEMLRELERTRFYGSLEIKFEGGRVVLLKKTETIKPADGHQRNNRGCGDDRDS